MLCHMWLLNTKFFDSPQKKKIKINRNKNKKINKKPAQKKYCKNILLHKMEL